MVQLILVFLIVSLTGSGTVGFRFASLNCWHFDLWSFWDFSIRAAFRFVAEGVFVSDFKAWNNVDKIYCYNICRLYNQFTINYD